MNRPPSSIGAAYGDAAFSVVDLIARYREHCEGYYRGPDGRPTSEVESIRLSLRVVRELYGLTAAADFGPLSLKAVRGRMVEAGLSRREVNKRVGRVKRMFRWAVAEELVAAVGGPRAVGGGGAQARPDRGP